MGSPDMELTLVRQDLHEQLGNTVKAGVDVTRSLVKAKLGVVKTVADVVRNIRGREKQMFRSYL